MFLGKLVVCHGLAMVSASRVTDVDSPSTTLFSVKAWVNLYNSQLKCFAREDLRVRTTDGTTIQYKKDMEMQLRENSGFNRDPSLQEHRSWTLGLRLVASAKLEIVDREVVDRNDRIIPYFDCRVENDAYWKKTKCGASSNGALIDVHFSVTECRLDLTNISPRVRATFKIHAFVMDISDFVRDGETKADMQPRVHCYGTTDLTMEDSGSTWDQFVPKNGELIEGGTELTPHGQIPDKYDTDLFVTLTKFSHKFNGFYCTVMDRGTALAGCVGGNSWDDMATTNSKGFQSCAVAIVQTQRQ